MSVTVKVPIDKIRIPSVRASSKFTPEQMEFFKATVDAFGVLGDPLVRRVSGDEYELVAGKTRLEELKSRGETEISVKLIDADEKTALLMHIAENIARGSVDPVSVAKVMYKLLAMGSTIKWIAQVMGKSETWVRRTVALIDLPEEYQQAIKTGKLTPTHVYLAARMPTAYETDDALRTTLTHGWNTSIFETFVNNRIAQLRAAKQTAVEKGVDYTPPPAEPEKLISYKQCLLCGFRIPADKISVQLVCEDCRELVAYITSQLGPWSKCKRAVFGALQLYYGQLQHDAANLKIPSREASPE